MEIKKHIKEKNKGGLMKSSRILPILVVTLFLVVASNAVFAADYYVSPTGNDTSGNGSIGNPWLTIQHAIDNVTSTDTINIEAGTYAECLTINKSLSLIGEDSSTTSVTGGIQITGATPWSNLLLENLELKGDCAGAKNAVIDLRLAPLVSNFVIRDCLLDGESDATRMAFYGYNSYTGNWTWDGNEITAFRSWFLIDNTHSVAPSGVAQPLDTVIFSNNYVHDCYGSIAFRGKPSNKTKSITIINNTINDYPISALSQCWAAIEVNIAESLTARDNVINGVPEVSWGGEGQALQIWGVDTINVRNNDFQDNFQGVFFFGGEAGGVYGGPYEIPDGPITHNTFGNNTDYALSVENTSTGGPLNAELNYWGSPDGAGDSVEGKVNDYPYYTDPQMTHVSDTPPSGLTSLIVGFVPVFVALGLLFIVSTLVILKQPDANTIMSVIITVLISTVLIIVLQHVITGT